MERGVPKVTLLCSWLMFYVKNKGMTSTLRHHNILNKKLVQMLKTRKVL